MAQGSDDFYADVGALGGSDELRPVYERLEADGRAWSATVGDEASLITFARSLPRRASQEVMRMQSQPDHPEWETAQRLPYTSPDYQPSQRPSRLRTWMAAVAVTLVVALLGGSFYLLQASRDNGTPATPTATTAQATDTPIPTATATATPLPTITAAQFRAACPNTPAGGNMYQIGDLYVSVDMGFGYPSSKLPDGTPLKPFKLGPATDKYRGLPVMPLVNPELQGGGFDIKVCNASKSVSHRVEGVSVRIDQFAPLATDLNSWQYCDTFYQNGHEDGGGCGGGFVYEEKLNADFAVNADAGATVAATFVEAGAEGSTPLPLVRRPGQGVQMTVTVTPPTTPGTYRFSFSVKGDGVNLPFALLTDDLLLAPSAQVDGRGVRHAYDAGADSRRQHRRLYLPRIVGDVGSSARSRPCGSRWPRTPSGRSWR
jgi:hypothetical protein